MARAPRTCEQCGTALQPGITLCRSCGHAQGTPVDESGLAPEGETLSPAERRTRLEQRIQQYVFQGYRVLSQTDTTAQLVKPKEFSAIWFILWLLVLVVGAVVYIAYYLTKKDEQVYLRVDERGRVTETRNV